MKIGLLLERFYQLYTDRAMVEEVLAGKTQMGFFHLSADQLRKATPKALSQIDAQREDGLTVTYELPWIGIEEYQKEWEAFRRLKGRVVG